jgi:hypothetical protein
LLLLAIFTSRANSPSPATAAASLIAHHHDWWFENRWHHFTAMRDPGFRTLRAIASAVLAAFAPNMSRRY